MNKDISHIVLELCEAVEAYRPLSEVEAGWRRRALGERPGAWSTEDDMELYGYVADGVPRQQIADRMQRTNMSVRKRIQRMRSQGYIAK